MIEEGHSDGEGGKKKTRARSKPFPPFSVGMVVFVCEVWSSGSHLVTMRTAV